MMFGTLAVFVMGLRHGADPDHLAAIDNLTRNASDRRPMASRFVGSLFALGHSAMVIAMACIAAIIGARLGAYSALFARVGEIACVLVLLAIGIANVVTLLRDGTGNSLRSRLLPRALASATHPIAAIPTGALFGIGFETSSQLAAYGVAFSSAYWLQGALVGLAFCAGMLCTDTLDSMVLAKIFRTRAARASRARRLWIGAVTIVAFGVAAQQIAALCNAGTTLSESTTSILIVAFLSLVAMLLAGMHLFTRARSAA